MPLIALDGDSSLNKTSTASSTESHNATDASLNTANSTNITMNPTSQNQTSSLKKLTEPATLFFINKEGKPRYWEKNFRLEKATYPPENGAIDVDQIYKVNTQNLSYVLPANLPLNSIYVLKVHGQGFLRIMIFEKKGVEEELVTSNDVRIENDKSFDFIVFDPASLGKKNQRIEIKNVEATLVVHWYCSLLLSENIELPFNSNMRIHTPFAKTIQARLILPSSLIANQKANRLQIFAETSLKKQDKEGKESISMYINKGVDFPTQKQHNMQASGSFGYGLIITINEASPFYCVEENCVYSVTITQNNIDFIDLIAQVFYNGYQFRIKDILKIKEELEKNESVYYQLMLPKTNGTWMLVVNPTEHDIEMLANPGSLPSTDSGFKYRLFANETSRLAIASQELNSVKDNSGQSTNSFFVKYRAVNTNEVATFDFDLRLISTDRGMALDYNSLNEGHIFKQQVINYQMNLVSDIFETIEALIDLTYDGGSLYLIVKECSLGADKCLITQDDIDQINNPVRNIHVGQIFKFSKANVNGSNSSSITNKMHLNFNCDPNNSGKKAPNSFPTSSSCLFALGVYCTGLNNNQKVHYNVKLVGKPLHQTIETDVAASIKVHSGAVENFKLHIPEERLLEFTDVLFKVIAVSGVCDLYFSTSNMYPDASSYDSVVQIRSENYNYLGTVVYNTTILLTNEKLRDEETIYISVNSTEYCLFDLYPTYVHIANHTPPYESITSQNLYHRRIGKDFSFVNKDQTKTFMENFIFDVSKSPFLAEDNFLEITLNSLLFNVDLCVQVNTTTFNSSRPCDYFSNSEHLVITEKGTALNAFGHVVISVQKQISEEAVQYKLPIEFSIFVNMNEFKKTIQTGLPGQVLREKLPAFKSLSFEIDLEQMKERAVIFYNSDNLLLRMDFIKDTKTKTAFEEHLEILEHGIHIFDAQAFKKKYCNDTCTFIFFVYSTNDWESDVDFVFVIDDDPIRMKEGLELKVPSFLPFYFLYNTRNIDVLAFNVFSSNIVGIAFSRAVELASLSRKNKLKDLISEDIFDYKTGSEHILQIAYTTEQLKQSIDMAYLFFVKPNDVEVVNDTNKQYNKIPWELFSKVYLDTKVNHLEPFSEISTIIEKAEWRYYLITLKKKANFSVSLFVESGTAFLFINRGGSSLPTLKRYWKRSENEKGDILMITQEDMANEKIDSLQFTIGVAGAESSKVSLLFLPDFTNLIKIEFQKLTEFNIEKDKDYYLDFYNYRSKFETLFYSEGSDIQVAILDYDVKKDQPLIDVIADEANYLQTMTLREGSLPTKSLLETKVSHGDHLILRVKSTDGPARINFALYDPHYPIIAYSNKWFDYIQDQDWMVYFKIPLKSDFEKVELMVKLLFGSIEVSIADNQDGLKSYTTIHGKSEKTIEFAVQSKNNADIILFADVLVRVKSLKHSKYSLLVKPKEQFLELYPHKPELIYPSIESNIYMYYHLKPKELQSISKLEIEINTVSAYNKKPDLLFLENVISTINKNSPFLPMPTKDIFLRNGYDVNQYVVRPEIKSGYFIIRLEPSNSRLPIKVNININDEKTIEPNGMYQGFIEAEHFESDQYNLFLSEPGEFRLMVESCSDTTIQETLFMPSESKEIRAINYTGTQDLVYSILDERKGPANVTNRVIHYPIKKGYVTTPGMVKFRVDLGSSGYHNASTADNNYVLMSEFKSTKEEIVLKDYIDIIGQREENVQKLFGYEFTSRPTRLRIYNEFPFFKPQLFEDYPNIFKVSVKFYYYLMDQPDIEARLEQCGLAITKTLESVEKTLVSDFVVKDMPSPQNLNKTIEVIFDEIDLANFEGRDTFVVLGYISVRLYENENEEWQVGLDLKMTNIPYFVMILNNAKSSFVGYKILLGLGFACMLVILYMIFKGVVSRRYEQVQRDRLKNNMSFVDSTLGSIIVNRSDKSMDESALG